MPDPPALTTPAPPPLGAVNPFGPLLPGSVVAFHSKIHDRFVRMNGNGNMDGSDHKGMDELPPDWTWERFKVVDAGNDEIALWSEIHHRFIRMHSNGNMDVSDTKGVDELPGDWTWERFQVVDGGNGEWALWSKVHNRFMRLHADGNMDGSGHKGKDELPHDWTWERFNVVTVMPPGVPAPAEPSPFQPGSVVALHSKVHGRFVRMNADGNMDGSGHKGIDELPSDWTWERFKVVDAGRNEIAFWSEIHNRYIRMNSNGNMDFSDPKGIDELPHDWTWERFNVLVVNPPPPPPPPPLVECIPQAGDGTGGTEEYMLDTATMQECAEYVVEHRPAANAATWGRTTNKCYAEMDQSAVHPHNEWVNCYVSADGTS